MDIQIAVRARENFDAYRSLEYEKFRDANNEPAKEIIKRHRQLVWLIEHVRSLCQRSFDRNRQLYQLAQGAQSEDALKQFGVEQLEVHDQIELHTEMFYWIAWRMRGAIRAMPGLHSFEAVGVRKVRNHILEHVDRRGGVPSTGFGWGGGAGPDGVLVGGKGPTIATMLEGEDKGLYCNAEEFFTELERVTQRCILTPEAIGKN